MSLTLFKVVSSILAAFATIWLGLIAEHAQMKQDFQKLAPPPPPVTEPRTAPTRRGGSPRGMAHALQYHEGR